MKSTLACICATFLLVSVIALPAWTESSGPIPRKVPLDLPSGGFGAEDDEENTPEVIQFFGSAFEGDSFFFLLDKSGSMIGIKMLQLQEELTQAINSLSSQTMFGMVAFSSNVLNFSSVPVPASAGRKAQAIAWVNSLSPAGSTHMLAGAVAILQVTRHSNTMGDRIVIAVGDGLPNSPDPEETLQGIMAANFESLPFNTILFGEDPEAIDFMQELANATGGTFQNNP